MMGIFTDILKADILQFLYFSILYFSITPSRHLTELHVEYCKNPFAYKIQCKEIYCFHWHHNQYMMKNIQNQTDGTSDQCLQFHLFSSNCCSLPKVEEPRCQASSFSLHQGVSLFTKKCKQEGSGRLYHLQEAKHLNSYWIFLSM